MTLGQRLKKARLARGMTQSQVVGNRITRNMLSQIENDQASPSVGTLSYLADVLGVTLAWLLADEEEQAQAVRSQRLRECYRSGEFAACLELAPPQAPDDEQALILALAGAHCAQKALEAERFDLAHRLAGQALAWNRGSLYENAQVGLQLHAILARCAAACGEDEAGAMAAYRQAYALLQPSVEYHLMMARYQLSQEHVSAAEREIWSIAELPEAKKAEYLILRGKLAAKKEQYASAAEYLRQADASGALPAILERELCQTMELVSREQQDYKTAYEYAARQLRL